MSPDLASQAQAARLTRQLEHGTIRGDSVGLVDYEKLKIEVEELIQTTRARDKELPVLRSEAARASQVPGLAHIDCISKVDCVDTGTNHPTIPSHCVESEASAPCRQVHWLIGV